MNKQAFFNQLGQFKRMAEGKVPPKDLSKKLLDKIMEFLFPIFCDSEVEAPEKSLKQIEDYLKLNLSYLELSKEEQVPVVEQFIDTFPRVYNSLLADAEAIYKGDPAAESVYEVILSYPGFYAIAVYRIAHALHQLKIPILPRLFTEFGHKATGIDIHPAAIIGSSFCIDHGTGIVIGETAVIGDNVKMYQGVTLGALSVDKRKAGRKRHPGIGDNVTLYAGSTILGGETHIGNNSIIGGNVWLTQSTDSNTIVLNKNEVHIKNTSSPNKQILDFII